MKVTLVTLVTVTILIKPASRTECSLTQSGLLTQGALNGPQTSGVVSLTVRYLAVKIENRNKDAKI